MNKTHQLSFHTERKHNSSDFLFIQVSFFFFILKPHHLKTILIETEYQNLFCAQGSICFHLKHLLNTDTGLR